MWQTHSVRRTIVVVLHVFIIFLPLVFVGNIIIRSRIGFRSRNRVAFIIMLSRMIGIRFMTRLRDQVGAHNMVFHRTIHTVVYMEYMVFVCDIYTLLVVVLVVVRSYIIVLLVVLGGSTVLVIGSMLLCACMYTLSRINMHSH